METYLKIEDITLECCDVVFPAESIAFEGATGGCDSCGWGASAYLEAHGTCKTCGAHVIKEFTV